MILGVIAEQCDEVVVMYAGRVVERAPVKELFANPQHAYTRGLLNSIPRIENKRKSELKTIPGQVASIQDFRCRLPILSADGAGWRQFEKSA